MTNPPIPENANALTAEWMRQALGAGGVSGFPTVKDIAVENIGAGSGSLSETVRCAMTYHDDAAQAPESVVVKLASPDRSTARMARALSLYKREYLVYAQLAPHIRIALPALLYGDFEEGRQRFVIVLEDLRGMENPDQIAGADAAQAGRAIRSAAGLHGQFWNKLEQPPLSDFFARVGPQKVWLTQLAYLACLAPCLKRFGHLFSPGTRRLAEALGSRLLDYTRDSTDGPKTLTHGDFRLDNMFFGAADSDALTMIDWQGAGFVAGGLYDVSYFMATSVPTEVRRRIEREILEEYHGIVCGMGAKEFGFEECWRSYRLNMLGALMPCVVGSGGLDLTDQRRRKMFETTLSRTLAAIEDLDADELLPARSRFPSPIYFSSILSAGAYRTFGALYRLSKTWRRAAST